MKKANITLRLDKHGHDVQLSGVTPAEVAILVAEHHVNAGGDPVVGIQLLADDDKIEDAAIIVHLRGRFGSDKVAAMFPGGKPALPDSFEEARKMGLGTPLPQKKLLIKK